MDMSEMNLPGDKLLTAMISLLDDSDQEVVDQVFRDFLSFGPDVIPLLEKAWGTTKDTFHQERIEYLLHKIQYHACEENLEKWVKNGGHDLLQGLLIIAKYQYPNLNEIEVIAKVEEIKIAAWVELSFSFSPIEKVKILNFIFFKKFGFKGDVEDYANPSNSFINKVLETNKGNPILLCSVYLIVAQKLDIPIYGVNLPQHFVLAYLSDFILTDNYLEVEPEVLFYINAFSKGITFSKDEIDKFISLIDVEPNKSFYGPCNNFQIIARVLNNLEHSYKQLNLEKKRAEIENLKKIVL